MLVKLNDYNIYIYIVKVKLLPFLRAFWGLFYFSRLLLAANPEDQVQLLAEEAAENALLMKAMPESFGFLCGAQRLFVLIAGFMNGF